MDWPINLIYYSWFFLTTNMGYLSLVIFSYVLHESVVILSLPKNFVFRFLVALELEIVLFIIGLRLCFVYSSFGGRREKLFLFHCCTWKINKKNGKLFSRERMWKLRWSATHMKICYGADSNSDPLRIHRTPWPPDHRRVVRKMNRVGDKVLLWFI